MQPAGGASVEYQVCTQENVATIGFAPLLQLGVGLVTMGGLVLTPGIRGAALLHQPEVLPFRPRDNESHPKRYVRYQLLCHLGGRQSKRAAGCFAVF